MKAVLLILALAAVALAVRVNKDKIQSSMPVITQELIDTVNAQGKWKADTNKGSLVDGINFEQAKALMGVKPGGPKLPPQVHPEGVLAGLPTSFSAIDQWPQCTSIATIRDQSACGTCYAFAGAEAISDRICIATNKNVSISAADIAFCCSSCGAGCGGGYPASVWSHYKAKGFAEDACYPYPFPSCDHHVPGSKNPCPAKEYKSPNCPNKCTNSSWSGPSFSADKYMGKSAYSVSGVNQIMAEILKNGPVEASFQVYEDFVTYKSGVYSHTTGNYLGGHAVKILGWGVQGSTPYWIVANSWNPSWGNNGFFWILRGSDECGIEDGVVAGIPAN